MSVNLRANEVAEFSANVKDAYQGSGMLRNKVRVVTGVTGATFQFQKIGKGIAQQRIPQTEVIPMGIGHSNRVATIEDWHAAEYTDLFDDQKVNYSERSFLASIAGRAISRREDQLILDAIISATASSTVAKTFGGSNELNLKKVRNIKKQFDDLSVPRTDRHILVSPSGIEQMLGDTTNTSQDFASLRRLQDGEMGGTPWIGFMWEVMEDRSADEGGLGVSGTDRTCHVWHKDAVGLAIGIDLRTEVNYIAHFTSTLTNAVFAAGSVVIDDDGIGDVIYDEAIVV